MACGNVEHILHLSAFAMALPVAYFGLDKIHNNKDEMQESVTHIERITNDIMTRFQPFMDGEPKIIFNCFEVFVIATIARWPIPKRCYNNKILALLWIVRHCPMFRFFVVKADFFFVSLFFSLSSILFFFLSSTDIFKICLNETAMMAIYFYMVFSCLFVFVIAISSTSVFRLVPKISALQDILYDRWEKAEFQRLNNSIGEIERVAGVGR